MMHAAHMCESVPELLFVFSFTCLGSMNMCRLVYFSAHVDPLYANVSVCLMCACARVCVRVCVCVCVMVYAAIKASSQ